MANCQLSIPYRDFLTSHSDLPYPNKFSEKEQKMLADLYFTRIRLPEKAKADAYHLALATWHGMDFLLSWNCAHIVNGHVRLLLENVNSEQGIRTPVICTPEELMEDFYGS